MFWLTVTRFCKFSRSQKNLHRGRLEGSCLQDRMPAHGQVWAELEWHRDRALQTWRC